MPGLNIPIPHRTRSLGLKDLREKTSPPTDNKKQRLHLQKGVYMASQRQYATGKRKNAIARAWIEPGQGEITINGRSFEHYFTLAPHRVKVESPLEKTSTLGQFQIRASVRGGGVSGQAGALRHAIAKALVHVNPEFRGPLKKEGMLTRDSRVKERKKYGQKGARALFQYSKR